MASWKERGEVPDSDDEDDSQSIPNEGYGGPLLQELRGSQMEHAGDNQGDRYTGMEKNQFCPSADASETTRLPLQHSETSRNQIPSPKSFRKHHALLELNQLSDSQKSSSRAPLHADDEISQSYVRLSSSLSSLHTEAAHIQQLEDASSTEEHELHNSKPSFSPPIQYELRGWQNGQDVETFGDDDDFLQSRRRTLRQRNPIQLHPYALEGEKYRRTLMGRGLKPLRLTQGRDSSESTRDQSFPSSELGAEKECQFLSPEEESGLPQSSQPSVAVKPSALASPYRPSTHSEGEDDEFPDIAQLLDRSDDRFVQAGPKRRKTTYGSRHTFRLPPEPLPRAVQDHSTSTKEAETHDIPPSPPATNSPLHVFHAPYSDRRPKNVTSNLTSSRAVSLEYAGSERGAKSGNLPTPATNLVEHTIDLTADGQSDEDPFASDTESSVVSQSAEVDQSIQVRRVGKKIRGVLPASWLRLDQQTRQDRITKVNHREHKSLSPINAALFRRGIAVPKFTSYEKSCVIARDNTNSHFVLSDSDSDEVSSLPGFVKESAPDVFDNSVFSQTDMGSVMEDDRIDAMLPSKKRQTKLFPGTTHRKKRPVSTSLFVQRESGPSFQPMITEHLQKTRSSNAGRRRNKLRRVRTSDSRKQTNSLPSRQYRQSLIPKLSILDVVKLSGGGCERLPAFIRIAARNARSRKGLGRHSPTRKFIKLANRTDTQDARSVLQDWREGTLRPCPKFPELKQLACTRQALSDISDNVRYPAASTIYTESDPEVEESRLSALPRKILIYRSSAQPNTARMKESRSLIAGRDGTKVQTKALKNRIRSPKMTTSTARPAQLETSVAEYGTRHPSVAFGSTKKVLDTLYRKAQKGNKAHGDVQLARFFGDEYSQSNTETPIIVGGTGESRESLTKKNVPVNPARRQKRRPQHVDANAAAFRQPSEPLILDFLQPAPETQPKFGHDGKLLGLGKFGTVYTHHFDIHPLQSGVFFHNSTFIGSGRLSRALEISINRCFDGDCGYSEFQLAGKQLRWGPWDDTVSSEFGMCFDWMIEQLEDPDIKIFDDAVDTLIECITHLIDYVQTYLGFLDSASRSGCVSRATEILCSFTEQLEMLAHRSSAGTEKLRAFVELSCRLMVLSFQFLGIAQPGSSESGMVLRLESLLQKTAVLTISLLLSLGLAPIRNLYDDLQYLTFRIAGIKQDRYAAQAWVIAMHTIQAAHIPRISFWDVLNSQIIKNDGAELNDARVLEHMWYDMFSLLPLADFDMNGELSPGVQLLRSLENWALVQTIAKKIFELYNSKSRQSPSFNDYCRTLFRRCSYLMQTWGWRRHGTVIGTLFDFFATRQLANLRNEEVYRSPRFLEELDKDPSLVVESEDRCFHILLKIIATSIKQMRQTGDTKGIRNLVTRVLPNHDRQYPKEKAILQRDLASLRNHHDLLCTLFWAAPPELRPSITLIRELVDPRSSHQEAYLINLRSWENLTRFILAFTPTPTAYLPFATWHSEFFTKLLVQYRSAETDVQTQLRNLPAAAKRLISQQTIDKTVAANKNQIVMALAGLLQFIQEYLRGSPKLEFMKLIVQREEFIKSIAAGMDMFRHRDTADLPLVEIALDIVHIYAVRLLLFGVINKAYKDAPEDDSQEYGKDVFADIPFVILESIGHLNGEIMAGVRQMLRTSLNSGLPVRLELRNKIVGTWGLIAAIMISAKCYDVGDFLSDSGRFNELSMDDRERGPRHCAPRFLFELVSVLKDDLHLETTGRDLLSDWLCILINPIKCFAVEDKLLPVFAKYEHIIEQASATFRRRQIRNVVDISTINGIKIGRVDLVHSILEAMEDNLQDEPLERDRYRKIVQRMLGLMKADLSAMDPIGSEIDQHKRFVKEIRSSLITFFRDLCTGDLIDDNFGTSSMYPADSDSHIDPEKVGAILKNYGLRLGTARGESEFNHYMFAVLKYAAVLENRKELTEILQYVMGYAQGTWAKLSQHVLTVLTPSFIHTAFVSEPGWLLLEPLFEATQEHLMDIADCDRKGAIIGVSKIMASIVHGIFTMMEAHSSNDIRKRTSYELVYVLLMSTQFMSLAYDWLPFCVEHCMEHCLEQKAEIASYQAFFYHFACGAKAYFASPLEWFVESRPLFEHGSPVPNDMKILLRRYVEAMMDEDNADEKEQALATLAAPLSSDDEEIKKMRSELEGLHHREYLSVLSLFNHMRKSDYFSRAASILKVSSLDLKIAHFSGVILEDYRQNWVECPSKSGFQIKFGQEKLRAEGLMHDEESLMCIFDKLQNSLDEYIARYEKACRPYSQVMRNDRSELGAAPTV